MNSPTFTIEIPNSKSNIYSIITFIILCLNVFGFGFVFFKTGGAISIISILILIINAIPWGYYILNKNHFNYKILAFTFLVSAVSWFYLGNNIMAIFLFTFSVLGYFTNKKLLIYFSDDEIVYPSFPTKHITWAELNQVISKDNILTIDFKNNKLIQLPIEENLNSTFNEVEFNEWCKTK